MKSFRYSGLPFALGVICLFFVSLSFAQNHSNAGARYSIPLRQATPNAAELYAAIQKLNVLGSVLYFAAHPDDENTRLIAWLAKDQHYKTSYLSLTRGDGGQNLIGTELAEELGLVRTQELLLARSIDGGEQYFSRANDFGFSKTPEETLDFWGEQEILADAVWIIRKLQPDVIITRFPADARGGHGHHQAATILAIQAFEAAADSTRFPEQLRQGVDVWQAERLLWNTANFGGQNNTSPDQFNVDVGGYNVLLGRSYGEIAAESRSSHKTQGFGAARQRGSTREYFELLAGSAPTTDLFDGVETTWARVPQGAPIATLVQRITEGFDPLKPEASVPALIDLRNALLQLPQSFWKDEKLREVEDLLVACAGIWVEVSSTRPLVAQGDALNIKTELIVRRPGVEVALEGGKERVVLAYNKLVTIEKEIIATQSTQPYWLRKPKNRERFSVTQQQEVGMAGNLDDTRARIPLEINGHAIVLERPIVYKYTDPVAGEVHQALSVAPPVTVNVKEKSLVFANGASRTLDIVFASHRVGEQQVTVKPIVPAGWEVSPTSFELAFSEMGQEIHKQLSLRPSTSHTSSKTKSKTVRPGAETQELSFSLTYTSGQGHEVTESARILRKISHPHIPLITYFPHATVALNAVDVRLPAKRIGYLEGAGDLVPEALRQIGLEVVLLDEQDLMEQDLSAYDAIVSGVRLYNVNTRAAIIHNRLMDYVDKGGVYLVQYNVNTALKSPILGPHPIQLSRLRVTEEDAEVRFALPDHQVLNYPNKITASDFEGWVQERGLYFASSAGEAYERPLRMNDKGETELDGALLIAKHGQGKYVYSSLAFFRQLPAGVPGAYRLFMNLLAKPTE